MSHDVQQSVEHIPTDPVINYFFYIMFRLQHLSSFETEYIITHISFLITECAGNLRQSSDCSFFATY